MQGEDADQYEVIDYKNTYRLAQRPGSYVILNYQRDVVQHKPSQTLTTVAALSGLFDQSFADVSFIAGMLVDKYRYQLPLYRHSTSDWRSAALSSVVAPRPTLNNLQPSCFGPLPRKCSVAAWKAGPWRWMKRREKPVAKTRETCKTAISGAFTATGMRYSLHLFGQPLLRRGRAVPERL